MNLRPGVISRRSIGECTCETFAAKELRREREFGQEEILLERRTYNSRSGYEEFVVVKGRAIILGRHRTVEEARQHYNAIANDSQRVYREQWDYYRSSRDYWDRWPKERSTRYRGVDYSNI